MEKLEFVHGDGDTHKKMIVVVIMGVSGCGKTTVGKELAKVLGVQFLDGDSFHSEENVNKMRNGIPLTDEDRLQWLQNIHQNINRHSNLNSKGLVIGCSALKYKYRNILRGTWSSYDSKRTDTLPFTVKFLFLKGTYESLYKRLNERESHFMGVKLLQSQLETLEEPLADEISDFITVSIEESVTDIIDYAIGKLKEQSTVFV